jgi:hypothetical protein
VGRSRFKKSETGFLNAFWRFLGQAWQNCNDIGLDVIQASEPEPNGKRAVAPTARIHPLTLKLAYEARALSDRWISCPTSP